MKTIYATLITVLVCLMIALCPAQAQPVSPDQAHIVAENWIAAIISKKGSWGGAHSVSIEEIIPFENNGKQVGYFCRIIPQGYILISMRRELEPVKAYSARTDLDPNSVEGLTGLLKQQMSGILNRFEKLEPAPVQHQTRTATGDLPQGMEIDYRPVWDALENSPDKFMKKFQGREKTDPDASTMSGEQAEGDTTGEGANYQEGEALLTSHWHQFAPYNNDCPYLGCTSPSNGRAVVGCVATAGAQIMRYWAWPPYGEGSPYNDTYDWENMPDTATTSSPASVQAAVAELSREIGIAVGMSYGCSSSSANTYNMEGVYENHYRYGNVYRRNRDDYSALGWFDIMKDEFNYNRPVQYRITDHSIVGDGWQEVGSPVVRQYHMVYGWTSAGSDTWYTLDTLTSDPDGEEYLLENIRPEHYLTTLSGTFSRESFSYRYFYRDTWGSSGSFAGGQRIQFLPGVFVYGTGSGSEPVTFESSATYTSYLFTRGDLDRGIRMNANEGGTIKLYNYGGIKFH